MKRSSLIMAAAILLATSAAAEQIDGITVLKNMMESEKSAIYIATEVTSLVDSGEANSKQRIYHNGTSGSRIEYLAPRKLKGTIIADDGNQSVFYSPASKRMTVGPSRLAMMNRRTGMRRMHGDRINAEIKGTETVAGRQAYVIEIKPRFESKRYRRIWVDKEKWIRLKSEELTSDGRALSRSHFTSIRLVDSIPDSMFRVKPGSDVKVEQMRNPRLIPLDQAKKSVRFAVLEPSYLPEGFSVEGAIVLPFRGRKMLGIRYSNGANAFTVFQSPGEILEPGFLRRLHEGPVKSGSEIYSWRRGDLNLTIVGKVRSDEISRIAGSMK